MRSKVGVIHRVDTSVLAFKRFMLLSITMWLSADFLRQLKNAPVQGCIRREGASKTAPEAVE